MLVQLELCLTAYVAYCAKKHQTPKKLIEEIDTDTTQIESMPKCLPSRFAMHFRIRDNRIQNAISLSSGVKVGTSPAMKTEGTSFVSKNSSLLVGNNKSNEISVPPPLIPQSPSSTLLSLSGGDATSSTGISGGGGGITITTSANKLTALNALSVPPLTATLSSSSQPIMNLRKRTEARLMTATSSSPQVAHILQSSTGRQIILSSPQTSGGTTVLTQSGHRLTVLKAGTTVASVQQHQQPQQQQQLQQQQRNGTAVTKPIMKVSPILNISSIAGGQPLTKALVQQLKTNSSANNLITQSKLFADLTADTEQEPCEFLLHDKEQQRKDRRAHKLKFIAKINSRRCDATPIYGSDLRQTVDNLFISNSTRSSSECDDDNVPWFARSFMNCQRTMNKRDNYSLCNAIKSFEQRTEELKAIFSNFVQFVPAVSAPEPYLHVSHPNPSRINEEIHCEKVIRKEISPKMTLLHPIISSMSTQVNRFVNFR